MREHRDATVELERRYHRGATEVLERLRRAKAERGRIAPEDVDRIAAELGLPRAHVNGAASFYADLGFDERAGRVVRACAGTACFAATHAEARPGRSEPRSADGTVEPVYCLGYCYAGPAALDGETATRGPRPRRAAHRRAPRHAIPRSRRRRDVGDPVVLAGIAGAGRRVERLGAVVDGARGRERVAARGARAPASAAAAARASRPRASGSARGRPPSDGPALRGRQRRRGRPRLLRRPAADGARPARRARGHGARGVRLRARPQGYVYVRSEYPRGARRAAGGGRRGAARPVTSAPTSTARASTSTSRSSRAPARTSPARRPSLMHSMEGLRGRSRRAAAVPDRAAASSAGRPSSTTSRRSPPCPWIVDRGGDGVRPARHRRQHGHRSSSA